MRDEAGGTAGLRRASRSMTVVRSTIVWSTWSTEPFEAQRWGFAAFDSPHLRLDAATGDDNRRCNDVVLRRATNDATRTPAVTSAVIEQPRPVLSEGMNTGRTWRSR